MGRGVEGIRRKYRNRVQRMRLRAGIRYQTELADRAGIPRTTLSTIEANRLWLSSAYALLLREELGCSLDDLYERSDATARRS